MATQYGRNGFTVQEATNAAAYTNYRCQILTLDGTTAMPSDDWGGDNQPAKEIVLFSASAVADDDAVTLNILVSGDSSYGESIVFAHDNLPLTIKGILMDRIKLTGGSGDDDAITVLSFH